MSEQDLIYNLPGSCTVHICIKKKICLLNDLMHREQWNYLRYFTCVDEDYRNASDAKHLVNFVLIKINETEELKKIADARDIENKENTEHKRHYYINTTYLGPSTYLFYDEIQEIKSYYDSSYNVIYAVFANHYVIFSPFIDDYIIKNPDMTEIEQIMHTVIDCDPYHPSNFA